MFDIATERKFLKEFSKIIAGQNGIPLDHLRNDLGVQKYIDITLAIKRELSTGNVLDWGCGFGQLSYLLKKAGLEVQSYDLEKRGKPGWLSLHEHMQNQPVYGDDPVKIPFADAAFDAVVSCGVLEHVNDEPASLLEIRRILKPGGYFFIFMLPNRFSYTEAIATMRGLSDHPVKYTTRSLRNSLDKAGFTLKRHWHANMFPKNLTKLPRVLHTVYDSLFYPLMLADRLLCLLPALNLISGVHSAIAQRRD
ncbi:class I SAM-dependent methyltransferase [Planctomycetota bacterium]